MPAKIKILTLAWVGLAAWAQEPAYFENKSNSTWSLVVKEAAPTFAMANPAAPAYLLAPYAMPTGRLSEGQGRQAQGAATPVTFRAGQVIPVKAGQTVGLTLDPLGTRTSVLYLEVEDCEGDNDFGLGVLCLGAGEAPHALFGAATLHLFVGKVERSNVQDALNDRFPRRGRSIAFAADLCFDIMEAAADMASDSDEGDVLYDPSASSGEEREPDLEAVFATLTLDVAPVVYRLPEFGADAKAGFAPPSSAAFATAAPATSSSAPSARPTKRKAASEDSGEANA